MSNDTISVVDAALELTVRAFTPRNDPGEGVRQDLDAQCAYFQEALLKLHSLLLDIRREAATKIPDTLPRHFRIALATATKAFQKGDFRNLGTLNEDLQPLVDAAIAWGLTKQGEVEKLRAFLEMMDSPRRAFDDSDPDVSRFRNGVLHYVFHTMALELNDTSIEVAPNNISWSMSFEGIPKEFEGMRLEISITRAGGLTPAEQRDQERRKGDE